MSKTLKKHITKDTKIKRIKDKSYIDKYPKNLYNVIHDEDLYDELVDTSSVKAKIQRNTH